MDSFGVLIVTLVIGVLITRIIVVWVYTIRKYAQSVLDLDLDQSEEDWDIFKQMCVSAIIGTLITAFIILIISETVPEAFEDE